ncbi:transporter substrate-binding domain-containing protein [Chitinivorax sp. B]|uniref:substrate-binding periplasmic protein n=1 Tax=Chitinivorax sp. B TaxID=2502235 RepID=UPI0010F6A514|nr:transporter substrate-binding domain-containing protein [Chitinivorax sp. B]
MYQGHPFLALLFALLFICTAATGKTVYYQRSPTVDDARDVYPIQLLRLALDRSGGQYQLKPSAQAMLQGRALAELAVGRGVDVVWAMTSKEREAALRPIRIPIFKGLIGWRIPLVRASQANLFKDIRNLEQLKSLTAGQGHDWPDTDILLGNGIAVERVARYQGLFRMLTLGRFDYFPRSMSEIWAEADEHAKDGIVVDRFVVIHYPTAFYYFVNQRNTELANAIQSGLEAAIADGSFDKLFYQFHADILKRSEIDKRTVIELYNPTLPEKTPLQRRELWLQLDDLKQSGTTH